MSITKVKARGKDRYRVRYREPGNRSPLGKPFGDPTIKRTLTVLSAVLGKAVEWNRIPSNPVAIVRKPSGKLSKPVCTLAHEVVERLRVAMPSERDRSDPLRPAPQLRVADVPRAAQPA
jgi:hypothetical protein